MPQYGLERVDREAKVIRGASAAQAVLALGHGMMLDDISLAQVMNLGNARNGGIKSRFTHPGLSSDGLGKLLGRMKSFRIEGDKVLADLHLSDSAFKSPSGNLGEYVMDMADEDPDQFGMSIVFDGEPVWVMEDGTEVPAESRVPPEGATTPHPVVRVSKLFAVDAVDEPAANRDGLFSSDLWATNLAAEDAFAELDSLLDFYRVEPEKAYEFALRYFEARGFQFDGGSEMGAVNQGTGDTFDLRSGSLTDSGILLPHGNGFHPAPAPEDDGVQKQVSGVFAELAELKTKLRKAEITNRIAGSGLSVKSRKVVEAAFAGRSDATDEEVDGFIEMQRELESEFAERTTVRGVSPRVSEMKSSLDQIEIAVDALFSGRRPEGNIPPLQGIRELYLKLSGDVDMTGIFQPDRVEFANVTTVTMPNLVSNAMNKRVVSIFQNYDHWWKPIVVEEDAANLQNIKHLKLGGIGEMPEVAEGAAYQETTWADDYETSGWTKKGHYIGLTLESIDKDDTRRLLLAPRALAQSAYLTIGKDMARLFTQAGGTGPTLSDATAWFTVGHGNLGSSAFSLASWKATIEAMQKQTELGSGERLGNLTYPSYILVPLELQFDIPELLASPHEPTTANNRINSFANGETYAARLAAAKNQMIVVPFWTDANDWAAIADPMDFEVLNVAYRFGREPQIFSAQDPNSGLMFTNDTMPIKVRWFYSLGVVDHRGVYKHNVT